jgi:hypothetical protein
MAAKLRPACSLPWATHPGGGTLTDSADRLRLRFRPSASAA